MVEEVESCWSDRSRSEKVESASPCVEAAVHSDTHQCDVSFGAILSLLETSAYRYFPIPILCMHVLLTALVLSLTTHYTALGGRPPIDPVLLRWRPGRSGGGEKFCLRRHGHVPRNFLCIDLWYLLRLRPEGGKHRGNARGIRTAAQRARQRDRLRRYVSAPSAALGAAFPSLND